MPDEIYQYDVERYLYHEWDTGNFQGRFETITEENFKNLFLDQDSKCPDILPRMVKKLDIDFLKVADQLNLLK